MTTTHGTVAGYTVHGCRCDQCRDAMNAYNRDRRRLIAYGRWPDRTDATPVREHVQALQAAGMSLTDIARAADIPVWSVNYILFGRKGSDWTYGTYQAKTVRKHIADALLKVRPTADVQARPDAAGTRRRIQALRAIGYTPTMLADRLGWSDRFTISLTRCPRVSAATHRRVKALYDELSMTPWEPEDRAGRIQATRARTTARNRGWAPPLAWDDDTIDDPQARPHGIVRAAA